MVKCDYIERGDCLELMQSLPENSIDMVLCDLPYGTTPLKWDVNLPLPKLWEQYDRVVKDNGAIVLFGQEPFASYLRLSNINDYKYDWYWEKERLTNMFQVKNRCGKTVENISVFYKKQCTYNPQKRIHVGKPVSNKIGENARFSPTQSSDISSIKPLEYHDDGTRHPTQVLRFNRENSRHLLHPTQKPVKLLEYLIRTYTNAGMVVLDNCMGSGSTCIAAKNTGRHYIGFELDEKYFEIAKSRIEGVDSSCAAME